MTGKQKKRLHIVLWGLLLLAAVFFSGRVHYFSSSIPKFHKFSGFHNDSIFWWALQNQYENRDIFQNDMSYKANMKSPFFRGMFPTLWIVKFSNKYSIPRYELNLIITTAIFILAFIFAYLLGLFVLKDPKWAFFFGIVLSQSDYIDWLQHSVFVSHMMGTMMYPLVILGLIRMTDHPSNYRLFAAIFLLAFILYPISIIYYAPVIVIIGLLLNVFFWVKHRDSWGYIFKYIAVFGMFALLMFIIRYTSPINLPVDLKIMKILFKEHFMSPRNLVIFYAKNYCIYLLICTFSAFYLLREKDNSVKLKGFVLFSVFIGCVLLGAVLRAFANLYPPLAYTMFWRVAEFSYLPGILLTILTLKQMSVSASRPLLITEKIIPVLSIMFFSWVVFHTSYRVMTMKGVVTTYTNIAMGTIQDRYKQEIEGLVNFAQKTPKNSKFLLPHHRYQDVYTEIFEAESLRVCLLSFFKRGLALIYEDFSKYYFFHSSYYDKIEHKKDRSEFQDSLVDLAGRIGATHIILPTRHRFRLQQPLAYRDQTWLVYKVG